MQVVNEREDNMIYECEYCNAILENDDTVIFLDRAFMPSGAVFCSIDCLVKYFEAYVGNLEDIKPLIDADNKYPLTIPHNFTGGDRTEACSVVRKLASQNDRISRWGF